MQPLANHDNHMHVRIPKEKSVSSIGELPEIASAGLGDSGESVGPPNSALQRSGTSSPASSFVQFESDPSRVDRRAVIPARCAWSRRTRPRSRPKPFPSGHSVFCQVISVAGPGVSIIRMTLKDHARRRRSASPRLPVPWQTRDKAGSPAGAVDSRPGYRHPSP